MATMATSTSTTCTTYLPLEILFEIFVRLPVKSLVRFRCVSKYFYSLIADPLFVDVHHNQSLTRPGGTTIVLSLPLPLQANIDKDVVIGVYTINYAKANHENLQANRVRHLCGGDFEPTYRGCPANTMIFLPISSRRFAVCNLSTRQHISLDYSCYSRVNLGFDPITKTYKVLKSEGCIKEGIIEIKQLVLTLGVDKSWREVHSFSNCYSTNNSVHIDGVIYFINELYEDFELRYIIRAFDVGTESFSEIYYPEIQNLEESEISLTEVDGRLAIIRARRQSPNDNLIELWISKKSEEWAKHTVLVPLDKGQEIIRSFFVRGEIVVLIRMKNCYRMFFNEFGNKVWRKFKIFGLNGQFVHHSLCLDHYEMYHNLVELKESLFIPNQYVG